MARGVVGTRGGVVRASPALLIFFLVCIGCDDANQVTAPSPSSPGALQDLASPPRIARRPTPPHLSLLKWPELQGLERDELGRVLVQIDLAAGHAATEIDEALLARFDARLRQRGSDVLDIWVPRAALPILARSSAAIARCCLLLLGRGRRRKTQG